MPFEGFISRVYMLLGSRNQNLNPILKPEAAIMVFLRMRSDKITKNAPKNAALIPNPPIIAFSSQEIRIWGQFGNRK